MSGVLAGLACLIAGWAAAAWARRQQRRFMARPATSPAATSAPGPEAGTGTPSTTSVAMRVGGFEAWRLAIHPVFLVGLGLVAILSFGPASERSDLTAAAQESGIYLVPFAWAAMIAANLAALRSRREGTEELLTSLPTTPATRTAGHLVSGFVAMVIGGGLLIATIANELLLRDAFGRPSPGFLIVGPLIILGGCFLGVLTARWVPSAIVGVLLVIATFAVEGWTGASETSPARWLQFSVQVVGEDGGHPFPGPSDWHVLYLVGLVGIGAAVALARHGLTRAVAGFGALALLTAGIAGIAQTRQPSDTEVRRQAAAYSRGPEVCEARATIRYCVMDTKNRDRVDELEGPLQAVLARVPDPVRTRPLLASERRTKIVSNSNCTPMPAIELLSARVRGHVDPDDVWPADGDVHPVEGGWDSECNLNDHGIVLTLQVGAWAVGLPPTQSGTVSPCRADGQARSVLALWLAGQADTKAPEAIGDLLAESRRFGLGVAVAYDWATWPNWGVAWADGDMALALSLLERPADEVGRLVLANWDRLIDPTTPSAEFAQLAGVTAAALPTPSTEFLGNRGHIEDLIARIVGPGLASCP